jgi:hypothetical protein
VKAYRKLERGDVNPGFNHLLNVAMALRVKLGDILEDDQREWIAFDARKREPPKPDELWGEGADRSQIVAPDDASHS